MEILDEHNTANSAGSTGSAAGRDGPATGESARSADPRAELRRIAAVLVWSTLLTFFLFGPTLDSWWWILDDHRWAELSAFGTTQVSPTVIPPRAKLSFSRYLTEAFRPPDWPLGSSANRPTWFAVQTTWAYMFGDNVRLYYLARLLCFLAAAAAFFYAVARMLGAILAGLLTTLIAVQPFWIDILPRAQCESFAAWGSAVYLLGISLLLREGEMLWRKEVSKLRERTAAACIGVGGLVAVGSKENFTVLLFLSSLCLLILTLWTKRFATVSRSLVVVLIGASVLLYYTYKGVVAPGVDLYGNTIGERIAVLLNSFRSGTVLFLLCACLAVAGLWWFNRVRTGKADATLFLVAGALQCYLLVAGIFLNVFYNGSIPATSRYAYPFLVLPHLSCAVLIGVLLHSTLWGERHTRARKAVVDVVACVMVAVLLATGVTDNRNASAQYAAGTRAFRERIQRVAAVLRTKPATPLVFETHATYDSEFLMSVARQLRASGVRNQFYCRMAGYPEEKARTPADRVFIAFTEAQVAEGRFLPTSQLPAGVEPEVITFSGPVPTPGVLASFWPLP